MAINVSVQDNGWLIPDIVLLTQCYYHRGNPYKCHEEVLSLQPMIPQRSVLTFFPPEWDAQKVVQMRPDYFYFKHTISNNIKSLIKLKRERPINPNNSDFES